MTRSIKNYCKLHHHSNRSVPYIWQLRSSRQFTFAVYSSGVGVVFRTVMSRTHGQARLEIIWALKFMEYNTCILTAEIKARLRNCQSISWSVKSVVLYKYILHRHDFFLCELEQRCTSPPLTYNIQHGIQSPRYTRIQNCVTQLRSCA